MSRFLWWALFNSVVFRFHRSPEDIAGRPGHILVYVIIIYSHLASYKEEQPMTIRRIHSKVFWFGKRGWFKTTIVLILISLSTVLGHSHIYAEDWETVIDIENNVVQPHKSSASDNKLSQKDTITIENSMIRVKGAHILYKGKVTWETLPIPVSKNALITIQKNETIFFYHPSIGNAPLSKFTSALSLYLFMMRSTSAGIPPSVAPSSKPASMTDRMVEIKKGGTVELKTGITARFQRTYQIDPKRTGALLELANKTPRWAAALSDINKLRPIFFKPQGTVVPKDFLDIGEKFLLQEHFTDVNDIRSIRGEHKVETFGSYWRALFITEKLGGVRFTLPGQIEVIKNNPELVKALNGIDCSMFCIDVISNIVSVGSLWECGDVVVNLVKTVVVPATVYYYTDEAFYADMTAVRNQFWSSLRSFIDSGIVVAIQTATAEEVVNPLSPTNIFMSFWDGINAIIFFKKEIYDATKLTFNKYTIYDSLEIIPFVYDVKGWFPKKHEDCKKYAKQYRSIFPSKFEGGSAQSLHGNDLKVRADAETKKSRWTVTCRIYANATEAKAKQKAEKRLDEYKKGQMLKDKKDSRVKYDLSAGRLYRYKTNKDGEAFVTLTSLHRNSRIDVTEYLPPGCGSMVLTVETWAKKLVNKKIAEELAKNKS